MNQIKDIDLSESSFQGTPFTEANHFFASYTQSIFTKKLDEMKKSKMSSNRFPQSNRTNEDDETPRKDSNNVLSKDFFSPRSTKMLRDYTLSEKLRIKWLRSIRDYMKLQDMQVVYSYLKTANVKVLIRELRLRKCFSLWKLKYQECKNQKKWQNFSTYLVRKQRTEIFNINAAKTRKTREALAKASVKAEIKNNEGNYGINEKLDEFAEKTVENMLQPILSLKPTENPTDKLTDKQNSSSHRHHHHRSKQSDGNNGQIKSRDINLIEENKENENDNQTNENTTPDLAKENEVLERRISDCERRIREQEQSMNKIIHQFTILAVALGVIIFIFGLIVGKSIVSNKRMVNTFVNSQSAITQELTAEVADFRIALTKMSGQNKTVVPAIVEESNLTKVD